MVTSVLTIALTARSDESVTFQCKRADGSATWQRHQGPRARYFPFHDLSHLAVERVLGARDGFFGLIADGWDIDDTSGKGKRGPIPAEGILVEHIVGLFDRDGVGGAAKFAAEEMRALLPADVLSRFSSVAPLTEESLAAIRAERERLFGLWSSAQTDQLVELMFERPAVSRLSHID